MKLNVIENYYDNQGNICKSNDPNVNYTTVKLLGNHKHEDDSTMNVLISAKCVDAVLKHQWYCSADGYAITYAKFGRLTFALHQFVYRLFVLNGNLIEKGMVIDHINRNRLDNRLENLRMCTVAENNYNRSKKNNNKSNNNKSKYRGVKKTGKTWRARLSHNGQTYTIDNISSEREAALTYNLLSDNYFGEYGVKNIIYD
jgi:hypothetical protein